MVDVFDDNVVIENEIAKKSQYTLYRGIQKIADSVSRPIVIRSVAAQDSKSARDEIELFAGIGKSPFITGILSSKIDNDHNAWMVFEDYGKSIKDLVSKDPAALSQVALLTSQMLQALIMVHDREEPLLFNPLLPDNIISNANGSWIMNSYTLSTSYNNDEILNAEFAKYMSPESFDADNFVPSAQSNLYSLGMIIYEYALGSELFKQQFPAVYNHKTSEFKLNNSLAERWMYWHTSSQLTLPPLKELIHDIPEDLSDIVALMLYKDVASRAKSAQELFDCIVRQDVNVSRNNKKKEKSGTTLTPLVKILLIVLLLAVGGAAIGVNMLIERQNEISLELSEEKFVTQNGYITIKGHASQIPQGARVMIELKQGLIKVQDRANFDNRTGDFIDILELPSLGEYEGLCAVIDSEDTILYCAVFKVLRNPPKSIHITYYLKPQATGAKITVTPHYPKEDGKTPPQSFNLISDSNGKANIDLGYCDYDIVVDHPYYRPLRKTLNTGIRKDKLQEIDLMPVSDQDLDHKKLQLQKQYEELKKSIDPDNPDPEKLKKMYEVQHKLSQFIQPNAKNSVASAYEQSLNNQRNRLIQQLADLKNESDNGSVEARKKALELMDDLNEVNKDSIESNLRDLQNKRNQLLQRVRDGDYSAVEKLKQFDEKLLDQGIDPNNIAAGLSLGAHKTEKQSVAVKKAANSTASNTGNYSKEELAHIADIRRDLAQRAKNGDTNAAAELLKLDGILRKNGVDPEKLDDLVKADKSGGGVYSVSDLQDIARKRQELLARAEAGDPETAKELQKIDAELKKQGIDPDKLQEVINQLIKENVLERKKLGVALEISDLSIYVASLIPTGAIKVEAEPILKKVTVAGCVYDKGELITLLRRLQPLQEYLEVQINIDPNKITSLLQNELAQHNIKEARVHPFLIGPQYRLYIGLPAELSSADFALAVRTALKYVSSSEAVSVERFPEGAVHE